MKKLVLSTLLVMMSVPSFADHFMVFPVSSSLKVFEVGGLNNVELLVPGNANPKVTIKDRGISAEIELDKLSYFSSIDVHSGVMATSKDKLLYAIFPCAVGDDQVVVALYFSQTGKVLEVGAIDGMCENS
ncbi:hypothetical protein [Simiduia agarivorans]|nr:hypothetical protein [Simiduia agarivorans]